MDSGVFCFLFILRKRDPRLRYQTSSRAQTHVTGAIMEMKIQYDNSTVQYNDNKCINKSRVQNPQLSEGSARNWSLLVLGDGERD